tara:strand:- start:548 stop:1246 length:699 start_codon:yes stop_codon:yes gene_type:complete
MSNISSYPRKNKPSASDMMIGTSIENGSTKNFSINALSIIAINQYLGTNSFKFVIEDEDGNRPVASISFENYEGDLTPYADITELYVNTKMLNGTYSINYLTRLIGTNIAIADKRDLDRYGIYTFDTITLVSGDVYRIELTAIESSGNIHRDHYHSIQYDAKTNTVQGDKNFVFSQTTPSTEWTIQHDMDKFPSVSVVNNNNILMYGNTTYVDKNNLTINFSAGFSGKAYLN